jgi:hypothetical protein
MTKDIQMVITPISVDIQWVVTDNQVILTSGTRPSTMYSVEKGLRAALHLEAGPIPLEADCMKFQPFLGWRPASTTQYNKNIRGANFLTCKGLRAKKLGRFNKFSMIQQI